jgi:hypothetical protein
MKTRAHTTNKSLAIAVFSGRSFRGMGTHGRAWSRLSVAFATGLDDAEIAWESHIPDWKVQNYSAWLIHCLRLRGRSELIGQARSSGDGHAATCRTPDQRERLGSLCIAAQKAQNVRTKSFNPPQT